MNATDFSPALEPSNAGSSPTPRLFELRKYNTGPDGLASTVERFKLGLAAILSKSGMTPIGFWTAEDRSAFVYLVAHKDREAARASWSGFMTDYRPFMADYNARHPPDQATGAPARRTPDDNRFLVPTDYSPRR